MTSRVQILLRIVTGAVLGWQATAAVRDGLHRVVASSDLDAGLRLCADTATRVRRVLGDDAELVASLRLLVPPRTMVCNRQVQGSLEELQRTAKSQQELVETFERLSARNGLFVQLATLLYADPFFVSVPEPIPLVETEIAAGRAAWLFVLEGDPEPEGRAGWQRVHGTSRFRLWRFQKV